MPNKSQYNLYGNLLNQIGQDFLDKQYIWFLSDAVTRLATLCLQDLLYFLNINGQDFLDIQFV